MTMNTCTSYMQGTTQGLMGNAQAQPLIANVQGMTQGTMGNAQGIIQQGQGMGTGIFQQNGHSQGIGQPLLHVPNMTYVQGNPQVAGVDAGMGNNQQLLNQLKQMSINNPVMLMALQELESRMDTNMTPAQGMAGVSPGYTCQGLFQGAFQGNSQGVPNLGMFQGQNQGSPQILPPGIQMQPQGISQIQSEGIQQMQPQGIQQMQPQGIQVQPQGIQVPPTGMSQVQQLGQYNIGQMVQPQVQQPMVQQVMQQLVQSSVQPPLVQQPAVLQQMQLSVQQPVVQQPAVQHVQQLVVQQPIQQQVVQQPVIQQPVVQQVMQPVVQEQLQHPTVSSQGILLEQNQVMTQGSYQGILQVCNQDISHVPSEGTLQCPYQETTQVQNQGLQLENIYAEMQPVNNQGYLGMALALIKSNYNLPQSQQEDPGVPQQIPEVKSSLCQPNADHLECQLDEDNQTDKLCGQHGTEVGGHDQPDDQGQISQHDNTNLVQVLSSQTVTTLMPESDSAERLMTDVPEQTWQPLLPSLTPKSNEDQSLLVQSTRPSLQDSDYNSTHGEVSTDVVNSTYEDSNTPIINDTGNNISQLDDVIQADYIECGLNTKAQQQMEGHKFMADLLHVFSADIDHATTTSLGLIAALSNENEFCQQGETIQDYSPVYLNHEDKTSIEVSGDEFQPHIQGMKSSTTDSYYSGQGEENLDFSTTPFVSSVATYSDMHQALTQGYTSQCPRFLSLNLLVISATSWVDWTWENDATSAVHHESMWCPIHKWRWCDQRCMRQLHCACWKYPVTETKFKPPDRHKSHIKQKKQRWRSYNTMQWTNATYLHDGHGNSFCQQILKTETKFQPPDKSMTKAQTLAVDEWCRSWCQSSAQGSRSQNLHNTYQLLEVETKFRPPDATHLYM